MPSMKFPTVFFVKYFYWSTTFLIQLLRTTIYKIDNRQRNVTCALKVTEYISEKNNNVQFLACTESGMPF